MEQRNWKKELLAYMDRVTSKGKGKSRWTNSKSVWNPSRLRKSLSVVIAGMSLSSEEDFKVAIADMRRKEREEKGKK